MRKHLLRVILVSSLLFVLLAVHAFADEATVTGSEVNLRTGPGTNYAILDCLESGAVVTVNDCSNSYWYNVTYNGMTGFMSSYYLNILPAQVTETVTESPTANGYINAMYVRFRSGPGTGYSVLGEYSNGTKLTITGSADGWTKVAINGQEGYVFSSYVSAETPAPAVLPEPAQQPEPAAVDPVQQPEPAAADPVQPDPVPAAEPVSAPAYTVQAEDTRTGTISGNYVRFRSGPGTNYTILADYNSGTPLTVTGSSNGWSKVVIYGTEGFVFSQYVKLDPVKEDPPQEAPAAAEPVAIVAAAEPASSQPNGFIRGTCVRFRAGASTGTAILNEYNTGTPLTILGNSGSWTRCIINGQEGYVFSDYVSAQKPSVSTQGSSKGQEIANYALQYLGSPYLWGGTSPDTGFDCSGFVYYVYGHFGHTIQRVACNQALEGVHVDHDDLQPGDILCFYSSGDYIGHSGIYIGNGQFIHSSTYSTGVIISDLDTDAYEARRLN